MCVLAFVYVSIWSIWLDQINNNKTVTSILEAALKKNKQKKTANALSTLWETFGARLRKCTQVWGIPITFFCLFTLKLCSFQFPLIGRGLQYLPAISMQLLLNVRCCAICVLPPIITRPSSCSYTSFSFTHGAFLSFLFLFISLIIYFIHFSNNNKKK